MIRFCAFLVVVALGLLIAGIVTSDMKLVFASIGVSAVALVVWCVAALTNRRELFGQPSSTGPSAVPRPAEPVGPEAAAARIQPAQPAAQAPPWEVAVPASGWPVAAAQPGETMAHATAAAPWGSAVKPPAKRAPGAWEWRQDAPATQPLPRAVGVPAPASSAADPPTMTFPVSETLPAAADLAPAQADAAPAEAPETPPAPEALETAEVAEAGHEPEAVEDEQPDTPTAEDHPSPDAQDAADEQASDQLTQQLPEPAAPEAAPEPAAVDLEREVTVIPGVPRYHNAQCLLIRFMDEGDLDKMTLGAAQQAGCTPCRACLPGLRPPGLRPPEPER